jgi:hypothetical protein
MTTWQQILLKAVGVGLGATVGLLGFMLWLSSGGRRSLWHQEGAGCGVNAELRRINFPAVFNPNSVELEYLVTNHSGQDYELPETFRVLRKSSDNVLHDHADNLGFPINKFFPHGHSVEFSVWVDVGNLVNHAPTEKETAELEKQFAGTRSYVLFDEKHRCEIELPVHQ